MHNHRWHRRTAFLAALALTAASVGHVGRAAEPSLGATTTLYARTPHAPFSPTKRIAAPVMAL